LAKPKTPGIKRICGKRAERGESLKGPNAGPKISRSRCDAAPKFPQETLGKRVFRTKTTETDPARHALLLRWVELVTGFLGMLEQRSRMRWWAVVGRTQILGFVEAPSAEQARVLMNKTLGVFAHLHCARIEPIPKGLTTLHIGDA